MCLGSWVTSNASAASIIRVINSALATSALALTVKNVTSAGFIGMTALPATGGNGIQVIANGSANISSIAVQNNTIHHCWVEGILISQNSTSASLGTVTIGGSGQGNTFFDNGGHVNVATTASAVITSVNVTHNAMTQNPAALSTPANPILISAAGSTGGINNLTLQANTIGTTGVAKSGCNGCSGGIRLVSDGTGGAGNTPTISNMLIDGNTIRDTTGNGVQILIRNGSAKACGTITNNDIREADPSSIANAFNISSGTGSDTTKLSLNFHNNTVDKTWTNTITNPVAMRFINQTGCTFILPGLADTSSTGVNNYLSCTGSYNAANCAATAPAEWHRIFRTHPLVEAEVVRCFSRPAATSHRTSSVCCCHMISGNPYLRQAV